MTATRRGKVVLAYSGGLDTSVMVPWIQEKYNLDVVTFTVDLGCTGDMEKIKQKALKTGAVDAITQDARNLFVDCFVFPALAAGALYEGKYPLATALGRHMGLDVYYEPVEDNEYLADFYRDTAKYSFATQIYLLNRRFQQHQEIIWRGRPAIQDRTIYEDAIFAKMLSQTGLMDPRDYRTYLQLFKHMSNFMCKPSAIIYLDVKPERSMERIRERSRGVESGISLAYLQALYDEYEVFVQDISRRIPTIRVSWDQYRDVEEMAEVIRSEYMHQTFLREVSAWQPTSG